MSLSTLAYQQQLKDVEDWYLLSEVAERQWNLSRKRIGRRPVMGGKNFFPCHDYEFYTMDDALEYTYVCPEAKPKRESHKPRMHVFSCPRDERNVYRGHLRSHKVRKPKVRLESTLICSRSRVTQQERTTPLRVQIMYRLKILTPRGFRSDIVSSLDNLPIHLDIHGIEKCEVLQGSILSISYPLDHLFDNTDGKRRWISDRHSFHALAINRLDFSHGELIRVSRIHEDGQFVENRVLWMSPMLTNQGMHAGNGNIASYLLGNKGAHIYNGNTDTLSDVADVVTTIADTAAAVIGPLSQIGAVAGVFDSPTNVSDRSKSNAVGSGAVNAINMNMVPNDMSTDYSDHFGSEPITGDISQIIGKPFWIDSFKFGHSHSTGDVLYSVSVCPFQQYNRFPFLTSGSQAFTVTPLAYYSQCFSKWRGGLEFTFELVNAEMQKGHIVVAFDPTPEYSGPNQYTPKTYKKMRNFSTDLCNFDVIGNKTIVRVPFVSNTDYKNVPNDITLNTTDFRTIRSRSETGRLVVYVANVFGYTSDAVADEVEINVYIRACDDFEFINPCRPRICALDDFLTHPDVSTNIYKSPSDEDDGTEFRGDIPDENVPSTNPQNVSKPDSYSPCFSDITPFDARFEQEFIVESWAQNTFPTTSYVKSYDFPQSLFSDNDLATFLSASMNAYYKGRVKFTLKCAATGFHQGMIFVCWIPSGLTTSFFDDDLKHCKCSMQMFPHAFLSVNGNSQCELEVPFSHVYSCLTKMNGDETNVPRHSGSLRIYFWNKVDTGSSTSANIGLTLTAKFDSTELTVPTDIAQFAGDPPTDTTVGIASEVIDIVPNSVPKKKYVITQRHDNIYSMMQRPDVFYEGEIGDKSGYDRLVFPAFIGYTHRYISKMFCSRSGGDIIRIYNFNDMATDGSLIVNRVDAEEPKVTVRSTMAVDPGAAYFVNGSLSNSMGVHRGNSAILRLAGFDNADLAFFNNGRSRILNNMPYLKSDGAYQINASDYWCPNVVSADMRNVPADSVFHMYHYVPDDFRFYQPRAVPLLVSPRNDGQFSNIVAKKSFNYSHDPATTLGSDRFFYELDPSKDGVHIKREIPVSEEANLKGPREEDDDNGLSMFNRFMEGGASARSFVSLIADTFKQGVDSLMRLVALVSKGNKFFCHSRLGRFIAKCFGIDTKSLETCVHVLIIVVKLVISLFLLYHYVKYILPNSVLAFFVAVATLPIMSDICDLCMFAITRLSSSAREVYDAELPSLLGDDPTNKSAIVGIVTSVLVGAGMFGAAGINGKSQVNDLYKSTTRGFMSKVVSSTYSAIETGISYAICYFKNGTIEILDETIVERAKTLNLHELSVKYQVLQSSGHFEDNQLYIEDIGWDSKAFTGLRFHEYVFSVFSEFAPYFHVLKSSKYGYVDFNAFWIKLNESHTKILNSVKYRRDRMEPIGIMLRSEPGIGKSMCSKTFLPLYILSKTGKIKNIQELASNVYAGPTDRNEKYWNAYSGQPWVNFDDWGSNADGSDAVDSITLISSNPKTCTMAALEDKGKCVVSDFMCASTNLESFHHPTIAKAITNPEALVRRWKSYTLKFRGGLTGSNSDKFKALTDKLGKATSFDQYFSILDEYYVLAPYDMMNVGNNRIQNFMSFTMFCNTIVDLYKDKCSVHDNISSNAFSFDLPTFRGGDEIAQTQDKLAAVGNTVRLSADLHQAKKVVKVAKNSVFTPVGTYAQFKQACCVNDSGVDDSSRIIFHASTFSCYLACGCPGVTFDTDIFVGKDKVAAGQVAKLCSCWNIDWSGIAFCVLVAGEVLGILTLVCTIFMIIAQLIKRRRDRVDVKGYDEDHDKKQKKRLPKKKHVEISKDVDNVFLGDDQHYSKLSKNHFTLYKTVDMLNFEDIGHVFFVDRRHFVINNHYVERCKRNGHKLYIKHHGDWMHLPVDGTHSELMYDEHFTELLVFRFPGFLAGVKDMTSNLCSKGDISSYLDGQSKRVKFYAYGNPIDECSSIEYSPTLVPVSGHKEKYFGYNVHRYSCYGSCGSLFLKPYDANPRFVLGMLFAGTKKTSSFGPLCLEEYMLCRDSLDESCGKKYAFEDPEIEGDVSFKGNLKIVDNPKINGESVKVSYCMTSQKVKTPIHSQELFPDNHTPAHLNFDILHKRKLVYDSSSDIPAQIPSEQHRNYAINVMNSYVSTVPYSLEKRVLTDYEIMNYYGSNHPFDLDSSAGIWSQISKKKRGIITSTLGDTGNVYSLTEEASTVKHPLFNKSFVDFVRDSEKSYLEGKIPLDLFQGTLKDELRPLYKVKQGKTRFFTAASLSTNWLYKKYFGAYADWVRTHPGFKLKHGIGNDKESCWRHYADCINEVSGSFKFFDYSDFGVSIPVFIVDMFIDHINCFYDDEGSDAYKIRQGLLEFLCTSGVIVGDCVIFPSHGSRDGFYMTELINSFTNSVVMIMCFSILYEKSYGVLPPLGAFDRLVRIITYGDDVVGKTESCADDYYTNEFIVKVASKMGLKMTSAIKTEPVRDDYEFSDITFLKSHFRKEGKVCFAPYPREVLYKIVNWCKKSVLNDDLIRANNYNTAIRMSAYESKSFFKEFKSNVISQCEKFDPHVLPHLDVSMTYESIYKDILVKQDTYDRTHRVIDGSYLIFDTHKGDAERNKVRDSYVDFLNERDISCTVYSSSSMGEFRSFLNVVDLSRFKKIVLFGGDGILNSFVNTYTDLYGFLPSMPLFYIPTGSACSFGRKHFSSLFDGENFDYPRIFHRSVMCVRSKFHLIKIIGPGFSYYAVDHLSFGAPANVVSIAESSAMKGNARYVTAALSTVVDKAKSFKVNTNKEDFDSTDLFVSIGDIKSPSFPLGLTGVDSPFNVSSLNVKGRVRRLFSSYKVFVSNNSSAFSHYDVSFISLKTDCFLVDGNYISLGKDVPVRVSLMRNALVF
ncbi:hypothetical protein [Beihai paphia shell virus 3]|uniref:hypothetical protein n=1 Tax=Beihai paphia shell virus 3 TaxID=1922498 RepID=UPI0009099F73|nr:hypothetical protein [Beihai paphia shell virus 3]APG78974.1 hypothetical protein [Beihai paphia shell virus 3]